ncbi:MAG: Two-component system response regulator BaeR [uncultured Thiotrichaceae bacterium]|uniref:Two-component system response regulator BaeR n=1 Tax=uncultured Thiotrichaceae bacterium TaxID=298394 RepID=A0A6S6SFM2_9GAMM|nr:MAG: Two-component system response regulator BaeR [uncultured Thiotrichaceae bacterium]
MKHILIVEDEIKIAQLLEDYLQANAYQTSHLADGLAVEAWVKSHNPDLILLDIMLPGKDGLEICKALRHFTDVPIIMLTARVEEIDRILGLEIGADDYICKPFSSREVVVRVKAMLRRLDKVMTKQQSHPLTINRETFIAQYGKQTLTLTPVEFKLLDLFNQHPERVYHRDQLLDHIYDDGRVVTHRTIDTHIKNLRKKLQQVGAEEFTISSVYGVGYKSHVSS